MNKLWVAVFLTSVSWLFSLPVFTPASGYSWAFIALSLIISFFCFARSDKLAEKKPNLFLLFSLVIVSLLLPYPFNIGMWAVAAGMLLYAMPRFRRLGNGISVTGILLSFEAAMTSIYYLLAQRLHESKQLAFLLKLFLNLFGLSSGVQDESIYIQANTETLRLSVSFEMFGSLLFILFVTSGLVILFITNAKAINYIKFAIILPGYFMLRLGFIALLLAGGADGNIMWSPWFSLFSCLPLVPVLMCFIPLQGLRVFESAIHCKHFISVSVLSCLSILILIGVFEFHDPGVKKQGRVLLDEKHSNWEWTTEEYDTKSFGVKSGYNYNCFYQYLDLYFDLERNNEAITEEKLSGTDVLIIKTPTAAFSNDEVYAIEQFVYNGGGLYLIGDHTNVFGTSTYLNEVGKPFGIRLNYDATYELTKGQLSEYSKPSAYPHPIVLNIPTFLFATSCTMDAPILSEDVITGYGLKSSKASYSQKNFFPEQDKKKEFNFGLFLQASSVNHGLGRVVTFTDSTVFSNFWMYMPGKPELALNSINWLNHRNTAPNLKIIMLSVFFIFFIVTIVLSIRLHFSNAILPLISGALIAIAISLLLYPGLDKVFYKEPSEHTPYTKICFEQEYSDFTAPSTWEGFTSRIDNSYHTFFVWNQRLGYIPSIEPLFTKALEKGNLLVIINPKKQLAATKMEDLKKAVNNGSKLLILGDSLNIAAINDFLEPFKLSISAKSVKQPEIGFDNKNIIKLTKNATVVAGGTPLLITPSQDVICSATVFGRGSVTVFSDSRLFSNLYMGDVSQVPNEEQKKISELHFWLIKTIVEAK